MVFALVIVCPILVKLFRQYNKEIYLYVLHKLTSSKPASITVPSNLNGLKTRHSGSGTVEENAPDVDLDDFVHIALQFANKVQSSLEEADIVELEQFRYLYSKMEQLKAVLPEFIIRVYRPRWKSQQTNTTSDKILPAIQSQRQEQKELSRTFRNNVSDALNQYKQNASMSSASQRIFEYLTTAAGDANFTIYPRLMFSVMQHIASRVKKGDEGKFSARLADKHDLAVAQRLIKLMRKFFRHMRDFTDQTNPEILR